MDKKAHSQERFGQYADRYVTSTTHAKGADLERLVEIAQPQSHWIALDVATGGGHTALKFAPHVKTMVSSDYTPKMLIAARGNLQENNINNALFSGADAENLPFADETFHLVTCRIAPHHFPDVFRFIQECYRVLKPDGLCLIQDHVLPDNPDAGRYVDAFERLRDPSHNRAFAQYEWEGMFLDAGFVVLSTDKMTKDHHLITWATRQECTEEVIKRLQVLLKQAPDDVSEWIEPQFAGTEAASFLNRHILILGRKVA